ncbi:endonuclease NucS [Halobacteria archaeon AArc-curdl1]|uniref:Endonuclease NucS n=1 Tax=Natronosalvus hydrolyticus TaxID=2979988 RepID=A0AAP2Z5L0_9EURY|nr:endonuclease NucS [Halobacteria archaeon AArc-curdl1]
MLRVGTEEDVSTLEPVSLKEEGFREDDLREWIINSPESILGEDFRLIGREVSVKQIGDGIDLLAIDRDANVVAIELKRGALKPKVDFQGLKYAAYTSHWDYSKLRDQFEKFKSTSWGKTLYGDEKTFTEVLDEFCNEDYTLNQDQRIVFVGESVRERLDIVLRWLSDRSIDISVIEFQLLKDGDRLYLDAEQTIPTPEHTVTDVSPDTSEEPWKEDGQSWHLNERSNEQTADLLEDVTTALQELEFLNGPEWGQKHYVAFNKGRKRRIAIRTKRTLFHVDLFDVDTTVPNAEEIAENLGIDADSVAVKEELRSSGRSGVRITCRPDQDLNLGAIESEARKILNEGSA